MSLSMSPQLKYNKKLATERERERNCSCKLFFYVIQTGKETNILSPNPILLYYLSKRIFLWVQYTSVSEFNLNTLWYTLLFSFLSNYTLSYNNNYIQRHVSRGWYGWKLKWSLQKCSGMKKSLLYFSSFILLTNMLFCQENIHSIHETSGLGGPLCV